MSRHYSITIVPESGHALIEFELPYSLPRRGCPCGYKVVEVPQENIPKFLLQAMAALDMVGEGRWVESLGHVDPASPRRGLPRVYTVVMSGARAAATTRALMRIREAEKDG